MVDVNIFKNIIYISITIIIIDTIISIIKENIPSLIIINEDAVDRDVVELCKQIRTDEDNTITPVIVVSSNSENLIE